MCGTTTVHTRSAGDESTVWHSNKPFPFNRTEASEHVTCVYIPGYDSVNITHLHPPYI